MRCEHSDGDQTVKDGKNGSGSQRYKCKACGRHFTPEPNEIGYGLDMRQQNRQLRCMSTARTIGARDATCE